MYLTTVWTRSSHAIQNVLKRSIAPRLSGDDVLLYSLSPPASSTDFEQTVKHLTSFPDISTKLGCISGRASASDEGGVYHNEAFSCSLALFSKKEAVPFRSTIPGPKATQVGRWHSFREKDAVPEEDGYNPSTMFNSESTPLKLPLELAGQQPDNFGAFVYFSDLAPQGLTTALRTSFPSATQLGLLGKSTPFITGRPVTLFENDRIHASGAVGVALKCGTPKPMQFESRTLVPLPGSQPMTVTQSQGNMVITLDGQNPTGLLLAALHNVGADLTAVGEFTSEDALFAFGTLGSPSRLYKITAGDPSRGPISLENHAEAPRPGEQVMFYYRPSDAIVTAPSRTQSTGPDFQFIVQDEDHSQTTDFQSSSVESDADTLIEETSTFLAGSENGFVVSDASQEPWRCNVPGGTGRLPLL